MSVGNGTTVSVHVIHVSAYDYADIFVRIDQIGNRNIQLGDAG